MKTSEVLQRARALIEDEDRWCTGEAARDEHGSPVPPDSHRAATFCATGAVDRAACLDASVYNGNAHDLLREFAMVEFEMSGAASVNDLAGHPAVLRLYDLAISAAMSDEAGR